MDIIVKLPNRIDSQNAQDVQKMIEGELLDSGVAAQSLNVTIDADDMQYISSAGLRVLLSIKKKVASLNIINASEEVADIFDVTGFSEFIPVSQRLEEVSVEGLEIVGSGADSIVYRLDKEKVIKVYRDNYPYEEVLSQQERTKKALGLGIDTMISYGIVRVGNSYGAIYEMLEAKSVLQLIKEHPENMDYYLELFVDFVKKNHEISLEGAKSIKKLYYDRIDKLSDAGFYSADEAMTARQIIYSIPDKDTYIHGDCHIGNILLSESSRELYFIDLPTLSKGNPVFDIFGMAWIRIANKVLDDDRAKELIGIDDVTLEKAWKKIISLYFETEDDSIIDELDKQYTALECLNLSMSETFCPGLCDAATLEWLKAEGMKAAEYEF